jgi:DNA polymerase-1
MDKLFLIDAYALIFRSYYAFINNPRINSKGMNTSAILGFVNTLREVIQKEQPTHIGVAFDTGKTFRHEAFPAYKAQREATPEDIKASVPIIKDILKALGIPILQAEGFEADDVIGTLATKAGEEGTKTYMVTPDKDYAQLVNDNVFIYRPRHSGGFDTMGTADVDEKYGIQSPEQIIDMLALMGDSADNFPGCPGVGEKTAAKLIGQFGSVDSLLKRTDELKGKLKENVESNVENIKMSYFLATIRKDVPIDLKMDELKMSAPDEISLKRIFNELEFRSLAEKMLNKPVAAPKAEPQQLDLFGSQPVEAPVVEENKSLTNIKTVEHDYRLITDVAEMKRLCDFLLTKDEVSMDTETTSTVTIDAELVGMSFAVEETKAFYVAVPADRDEAQRVVEMFRPFYENDKILKIGQNIKYDIEVLANYGIDVRGEVFDTMLAHYLIQPELRHNMDYMAETMLHYQTVHIDELIGPKGKNQKSMRDLPPEQVYEYAAEDADITLKLKNALVSKLKEVNADKLFHDIECPLVRVLSKMERNGVMIDTAALAEVSKTFTKQMNDYERQIYELAGEEFNISSPKQVGDVLFRQTPDYGQA